MESIRWHPIHQEYVIRRDGDESITTTIFPQQHGEALFGAAVRGGLLLKLVTNHGSQISFVRGETAAYEVLRPALRSDPTLPRSKHAERSASEATDFALKRKPR
ncbi:hypothetical protein [Myxococcus sp. AS-1-15]|uniref:hypothetical protein n=1 Tax=Myxococcus sp. AS-1-15 TaxID=2874600 RepID=UPI001CC18FD6|nr:hypothetical protein [Myxococcus sp. AS-1-15]MBZ4402431.1 hypothetical protein [Myxococcus sp. AS-1-15]